jgi:hypothetical protein
MRRDVTVFEMRMDQFDWQVVDSHHIHKKAR